jgi:hypothetical protein
MLGQPSPAAADPTGSESFCFQKRVVKDAELFALDDSGRVARNQTPIASAVAEALSFTKAAGAR